MRVTFITRFKKDLTSSELVELDEKLRKMVPELVGWSFSHLTGELTLDFGESEDNAMLERVEKLKVLVGAVKTLRLEFLDVVKE